MDAVTRSDLLNGSLSLNRLNSDLCFQCRTELPSVLPHVCLIGQLKSTLGPCPNFGEYLRRPADANGFGLEIRYLVRRESHCEGHLRGRFDLFVRTLLDSHHEVGGSVIFPDDSPRVILRVQEIKIVRSVDLIQSRLFEQEPFLEANLGFKHLARLQNPSNRHPAEVVAGSNVFDLLSLISSTEDVLIVSSGAVASTLHESNGLWADIGDPQSDDNFFPGLEHRFGGYETDLELVAWMSTIMHGSPEILCYLFRVVI